MIFYFTGTGNSLYAAKQIAEKQGEMLFSIAKEMDMKSEIYEYDLREGEILGFVFPVYAWAPPKIVLDFISRLTVTGAHRYIFSVSTCGDEEGFTTKILSKALLRKGLILDSSFTIKMPNNYIIGYDVDSKEVEDSKLENAQKVLTEINEVLKTRQRGVFNIFSGKVPALKSFVVNPLFNRFSVKTNSFFATEDCNGCKICEKVCPLHTIKVNHTPVWNRSCTKCLACISSCPVRAIQYGKGTANKGRYLHPDLKKSMNPTRQAVAG